MLVFSAFKNILVERKKGRIDIQVEKKKVFLMKKMV